MSNRSEKTSDQPPARVLVVGAGYAGAIAANRLIRKAGTTPVEVTVINPREEFVERVRLHQELAGTGTAVGGLREMLAEPITLRVGTAAKIGDGTLALGDGAVLPFDYLIYAPGGAPTSPAGTVPIAGIDGARTAGKALAGLSDGASVTVVGGGLTGVETAAEIAVARPELSIRLVSESELTPSAHPAARTRIADELDRFRITVEHRRYTAGADDGLVLWAIASQVSDLAAHSGLPVDADGRLLVDEHLRSTGDPRIFGAGDAAAVAGARPSCQAALPQGAHAADNVVRELTGKELRPFSMSYVGQNISLGRRRAVIQTAHRDDSPRRFFFGGRSGALFKEKVCTAARKAAGTGRYWWMPGPS